LSAEVSVAARPIPIVGQEMTGHSEVQMPITRLVALLAALLIVGCTSGAEEVTAATATTTPEETAPVEPEADEGEAASDEAESDLGPEEEASEAPSVPSEDASEPSEQEADVAVKRELAPGILAVLEGPASWSGPEAEDADNYVSTLAGSDMAHPDQIRVTVHASPIAAQSVIDEIVNGEYTYDATVYELEEPADLARLGDPIQARYATWSSEDSGGGDLVLAWEAGAIQISYYTSYASMEAGVTIEMDTFVSTLEVDLPSFLSR
jgi:hypothetical protein